MTGKLINYAYARPGAWILGQDLVSMQKNRFTGKNANLGMRFEFSTGEYEVTEQSRTWVQAMEVMAKAQVDADSEFDQA